MSFKIAFESRDPAEVLQELALSVEHGFTVFAELSKVQSMAQSTSQNLTVAEGSFLAYSMESIRNDMGATGKPIVVPVSAKGRVVALENLQNWANKAWEALKKLLAKMGQMIDALVDRFKYSGERLKRNIEAAVAFAQTKVGLIEPTEYANGELLNFKPKGQYLTVSQVIQTFKENMKNISDYAWAAEAASREIFMPSRTTERGDKTVEQAFILTEVAGKIFLGGHTISEDASMKDTDKGPVTIKWTDFIKEAGPNGPIAKQWFPYYRSLGEISRSLKKNVIEFVNDRIEGLLQGRHAGKDSEHDAARRTQQINENKVVLRHAHHILFLISQHERALNYIYAEFWRTRVQ